MQENDRKPLLSIIIIIFDLFLVVDVLFVKRAIIHVLGEGWFMLLTTGNYSLANFPVVYNNGIGY